MDKSSVSTNLFVRLEHLQPVAPQQTTWYSRPVHESGFTHNSQQRDRDAWENFVDKKETT